jgi:hypothetical protein
MATLESPCPDKRSHESWRSTSQLKKAGGGGRAVTACFLALGLSTAACEGEPQDASIGDPVDRVAAPLSSATYVDSTHKIFLQIKTCDWSTIDHRDVSLCQVDPGYVLVGGGAETSTSNSLLVTSYPMLDLKTWRAESKDHLVSDLHRLRAYAIGLSIAGVTESRLRSLVDYAIVEADGEHPTATATIPAGHFIVGGGARINYLGAGGLLTESQPVDWGRDASGGLIARSWRGSAKDHGIVDTVQLFVVALGLPPCIDGTCLQPSYASRSSYTPIGTDTVTAAIPAGDALASIGGWAEYESNGRLLSRLMPFIGSAPGATVKSKDHNYQDGGTTTAWAISLHAK